MAKFFLGLFTASVIWEVVTYEGGDKGVLISIILQSLLLGYYFKEVLIDIKKKKEEA